MLNQSNLIKYLLLCMLVSSCNTQPGKVAFPFDETAFKEPKRVKATPSIRQIPGSLPNAKYTTEKGQLVSRDQRIPLKKPRIKKAGQPKTTVNRLKQHEIRTNLKKRLAGIPQKTAAKGKTVSARGKVVMAGKPTSKPFMSLGIRDEDNYGIRYISQDQNLPGTIVYALLEDRQGRIWIGTDNGLAMLEGGNMEIYTTQEGLSSNRVSSLLETSTGAIWIGTDGGVDVFKSGSFTHYGTAEGLSSNFVNSLLESSTGVIWIGTRGGGLNVFDLGSFTHYGIQAGLSSNDVGSLLESATGAIWIGTRGGGLDVFDSGSFTHYGTAEGLSSNNVGSLLETSTGAIWIGTDDGVDVFESGSFTHYGTAEGLSNNSVKSLIESAAGSIWIGTDGGVDVFKLGSLTHYGTQEGLSSNSIRSLLESSTGAIWIGTYGEGLYVFPLGRFTHYSIEEGLSSNSVRNLLESVTGAIWIGTNDGVDVFKSGSFTHYGTSTGLSSNYVNSLLESATGAIWIGTVGGVDVFKSGSFLHYGIEEGLSSNRVSCLLESSTGAIWIGTYGGGVNVLASGSFTHYSIEEGLSSNSVLSLLETSTGSIWIGTDGGGLDVFESGSFTHYGTADGLSSNSVWSLIESSTGAIWIGTYGGGVDVFDSGSFTSYSTQEGLADNAVLQLGTDSMGNIWAGTGRGITCFVAKNNEYELTSWNKTHGFKYIDSNGSGNPMLFTKTDKVSKKGTMWSGIGQALTAFEPPLADTIKPTLLLTGIDIAQNPIDWNRISDVKETMKTMVGINPDTLFFSDKDSIVLLSNFPPNTSALTSAGIRWSGTEDLAPYHIPQSLELPFDQNHLTFHYSGLKLSEQFDVAYRYMLEGLDKRWSPFTKEGKADYRNIQHGTYTFRVRARGRDFLWSEEESLSFVVHPPWWLTSWAKTLWVFLILGGLYFIYSIRVMVLMKHQAELEQTIQERTNQKEEIKSQNSALRQSEKELQASNEELEASKDEITKSLEEKELLLRELYHRTKNNMQVISSMLSIQSLYTNNDEVKETLKETKSKVMGMALVHEKLYQAKDLSWIDLKYYITDLVELLKDSLLPKNTSIEIVTKLKNTRTNIDMAIPCGLIINELFTNAIKHGFPNNEKGAIKIVLKKNGDEICISVTDNGVGIPAGFDIKKSNSYGLNAVVMLAEHQLGGSITMDDQGETKFVLKFKEILNAERV
jgi:two-component sensor histidine kinase/ligand-binding sensor domain-containing protein